MDTNDSLLSKISLLYLYLFAYICIFVFSLE